MQDAQKKGIGAALGRIPQGIFILTAEHEDRRGGILVSWVQQCSFEPPMISVVVAKGRPILPLLSESRQFGLCQIPEGERVMMRKFASGSSPGDDPFLGFELVQDTVLDLPILKHSAAYLECELTCHMDVDGDHDIFIGRCHGGNTLSGEPQIHLRKDGFSY